MATTLPLDPMPEYESPPSIAGKSLETVVPALPADARHRGIGRSARALVAGIMMAGSAADGLAADTVPAKPMPGTLQGAVGGGAATQPVPKERIREPLPDFPYATRVREDGAIEVFRNEGKGRETVMRTLKPAGKINSHSASPDGKYVLVATSEGITVRNMRTWKVVLNLKGKDAWAQFIIQTPNGINGRLDGKWFMNMKINDPDAGREISN